MSHRRHWFERGGRAPLKWWRQCVFHSSSFGDSKKQFRNQKEHWNVGEWWGSSSSISTPSGTSSCTPCLGIGSTDSASSDIESSEVEEFVSSGIEEGGA